MKPQIYLSIILVLFFCRNLNAQFTDPLSVDTDGALPIDFEPLTNLTPVNSLEFDIDGDGSLETLTLSTISATGVPTIYSYGLIPGNYPLPTNTISSLPNTSASQPVTIAFSEPVTSFVFDLLDPQYVIPEVMATIAGLNLGTSSLGEIIEKLDNLNDPRGTVVKAFDETGNEVQLIFCIEDYDPIQPTGSRIGLSKVTNLSAHGGPVSAVSVPGDGNTGAFSEEFTLTVLKVTITAAGTPFSSITITAPVPGSTGVSPAGDFITINNFNKGIDQDGDGYPICGGDCDDNDAAINPNALEVCDGVDNDCDGLIDEDLTDCDDCTIEVGVVSQHGGCPNANDGSISALISGENNLVIYTLTGPVNGANNTGFFDNLPPGNYTLRATDGPDNEICSDEVDVTINPGVDNTDPVVTCSGLNFTTQNDPGSCTVTLDLPVPPATDNCGISSLKYRYRLVDNSNTPLGPWLVGWTDELSNNVTLGIGRYRIRWRATDSSGNRDFCRYFVQVDDVERPTIHCSDQDIVFDGEESIPLLADDLAVASDNCDIASLTLDINEILCEQLGDDVTVTATVVDENGLMNTCTSTVTVLGLPCGWSDQPIGCDGSSSYDVPTETFSLTSHNCHNAITNETDEYAFATYNLCGNGSVTAHVTSINGTSNGFAGVIMRESLDPLAKSVAMSTNLSSNHRREVRSTTGGNVTSQLMPAFNRHWLRISRIGNSFRIYASSNGISWFLRSSQTVAMQECLEVGLVLNGYLASNDITATFEDVVVTGTTFYELQASPPTELVQSHKNFTVFPNPTTGQVTVALDDLLEQEARLEVLDVNGRLVQLVREGIFENSTEELNIAQLPPGLYFIRLQLADGTVQMQRVVLQPRN